MDEVLVAVESSDALVGRLVAFCDDCELRLRMCGWDEVSGLNVRVMDGQTTWSRQSAGSWPSECGSLSSCRYVRLKRPCGSYCRHVDVFHGVRSEDERSHTMHALFQVTADLPAALVLLERDGLTL